MWIYCQLDALRQAGLGRKISKTAFLPDLDASATGAYLLPDMDMLGMELRIRGTYMAGVNLTQPIYTGGRISTGHRLAVSARRSQPNSFA